MPRQKQKDDSSDSDSGPEDRNPPSKKQKTTSTSKPSGDEKQETEDQKKWDLGRNRFAELTEFKGKWYVSIREFYFAGAELKPGKKGIMLTMEQWQKFKSHFDDIEEAIKKHV